MRTLMMTAFVFTLSGSAFAQANQDRDLTGEEKKKITAIATACTKKVEKSIHDIEAMAKRAKRGVTFTIIGPNGAQDVSRNEYVHDVATDCTLQVISSDPSLAPLLREDTKPQPVSAPAPGSRLS